MTAQEYVVTVVAACGAWDEERHKELLDAFAHLRPGCLAAGTTLMLRFCVPARDDFSACAVIKRRLRIHAAVREWRSFEVRGCTAAPLERTP